MNIPTTSDECLVFEDFCEETRLHPLEMTCPDPEELWMLGGSGSRWGGGDGNGYGNGFGSGYGDRYGNGYGGGYGYGYGWGDGTGGGNGDGIGYQWFTR